MSRVRCGPVPIHAPTPLGAVVLINAGLHRAEEIAEAVFTYLRGKKAPPPAV